MKVVRFILCLLFLLGLELFTSSIESNGKQTDHVDFALPVNHRIPNNILEFSKSAYIDYTLERFMTRNALTGASVAIVKDGKLVFTKGYGYASKENYELVEPKHLFRIASVSKLITAISILKIVETGKLSLDDRVFGDEGIISIPEYCKVKDKRLFDVTIKQLLNHTGGWTQHWGDPMFNLPSIAKKIDATLPLSTNDLIRFVASRRMHFTPGNSYSYSNLGYVFLGRVIEEVTQLDYETFVKQNILSPSGIFDMHLGHYLKSNKRKNEVEYYEYEGTNKVTACYDFDKKVNKIYGGHDIHLLGAAGGWLASAPELAKLLTVIDGDSAVKDILSSAMLDEMIKNPNYPIGWSKVVGKDYFFRTGSFTGTQAMICRRSDNIQWVFLTNCGHWKGPNFPNDIRYIMNRVIGRVKDWPDVDLFMYFDPGQGHLADL